MNPDQAAALEELKLRYGDNDDAFTAWARKEIPRGYVQVMGGKMLSAERDLVYIGNSWQVVSAYDGKLGADIYLVARPDSSYIAPLENDCVEERN